MGLYEHPTQDIITLASPDRNITTKEDLNHSSKYELNRSNTFKKIGSTKATQLNHLISHYTHGEYVDANVKAGNNKDSHGYGLLSNNCITGFIDIFKKDIPINKLSTIEQLFISRANKTLKHGGRQKRKTRRYKGGNQFQQKGNCFNGRTTYSST